MFYRWSTISYFCDITEVRRGKADDLGHGRCSGPHLSLPWLCLAHWPGLQLSRDDVSFQDCCEYQNHNFYWVASINLSKIVFFYFILHKVCNFFLQSLLAYFWFTNYSVSKTITCWSLISQKFISIVYHEAKQRFFETSFYFTSFRASY